MNDQVINQVGHITTVEVFSLLSADLDCRVLTKRIQKDGASTIMRTKR